MLPLRTLLAPYESLSLTERARALVLARDAGDLAARLVATGPERRAGILVWQRLVIEESLLRRVVTIEEAVDLMRRAHDDDGTDPRLQAFLGAWAAVAQEHAGGPPPRPLTVIRGGRAPLPYRESGGQAGR
jgi:hypothetical protein